MPEPCELLTKETFADIVAHIVACEYTCLKRGDQLVEHDAALRAERDALAKGITPTLHWSDTKPTEQGYWWLRDGSAQIVVFVDIGACDSFHYETVEFFGHDTPVNLCDVNGEWAGPLVSPQEVRG